MCNTNLLLKEKADAIASVARESLIQEVYTTPKPGLVDQNNNGAHTDMTLHTFLTSAQALYPYFLECSTVGLQPNSNADYLLPQLRPIGIKAEQLMYTATGGVNTHKGAIFSLGIFCAATGLLIKETLRYEYAVNFPEMLSKVCRSICQPILSDLIFSHNASQPSHGELVYLKYQLPGIRGEAAAGFPSVFNLGFPLYENYKKRGLPRMKAGACTLLHLISQVNDTTVIFRTNYQTLLSMQKKLKSFLSHATSTDILNALPIIDQYFIRYNISPGGCADLLALIYFLDLLKEKKII